MKRRIVLLTAFALVLGACATPTDLKTREPATDPGTVSPTETPTGDPTGSPTEDPTDDPNGAFDPLNGTDPNLSAFYGQDVTWTGCGGAFECTRVTVPMDYSNPNGQTIEIAVKRRTGAGADKPSLFMNPGGPGGSGTKIVESADFIFSSEVLSEFNPTGFDPRGVEESSAVHCLTPQEKDARNLVWVDLMTPEGFEEYKNLQRDFADKCVANTGELLQFVDTISVARDLDILRAVVGRANKLDYLGYSYGTLLGATYADLFPQRVGKLVLDGAVDPSLDMGKLGMEQAMGFDRAIRSYMEDCLAGPNCWHQGTVEEGLAKIQALWDDAQASPRPTNDPDRPLNGSYALGGVITALYTTFYWPQLTQGLDEAINKNEGTTLLSLADSGASRNSDGTYDGNSGDAFMAINCLDYPITTTPEQWAADAAEMKARYPVFGDAIAWGEVTCDVWPYKAQRVPGPIAASGSDPILVIGTTRDPATPYEWAVRMADQLENGHLLTYEGDGHTAYGFNYCINDHVERYFLKGEVPPSGATCS